MTDNEMSRKELVVWLQKVCNGAIQQEPEIFNLIFPKQSMGKDELLQGALVCYMLGMAAKMMDPEAWDIAKDIFKNLIDIDVQMEEEE